MVNNKKAVRFATSVDAGDSVTLTHDVKEPATIEQLRIRLYPGPELSLNIYPRLIGDNGNGEPKPLIDFVGKNWVDGDADVWRFDISESVEQHDVLEVEAVNNADDSEDLTYDFSVDMELDREAGFSRVVSQLSGGLL